VERDRMTQQLETGIVRCHELHAQVVEGREFYTSIIKRYG
jgi:hypothetical protein